jgi:CBS domain-containing protein
MRRDIESIMTRDVITINEDRTISDAVKVMEKQDISCLVVTKIDEPIGMITEKDMTRRVIAKDLDPKTTTVAEVMSTPLVSVSKGKNLADVTRLFREFGFRRVPIVENGKLQGIVTTTDISNQTSLMYDMNAMILWHQKIYTIFMVLCFTALILIIFLIMRASIPK